MSWSLRIIFTGGLKMISEILFNVLVFPGVLFSCAMALWFEWLERKITARVQRRVGPKYTGPNGLLQPLYDVIKLLLKEEIVTEDADRLFLHLAPILAVTIPAYGMLFIPITSISTMFNFRGDIFLILFLLSLSVFSTALAGFAVYSPYTIVGVGRLIVQYSIYESLFALSISLIAFQVGSFSIADIINFEARNGPLAIYQPLGFLVGILALLAKLEKPPFDVPHAKQEIVAGWLTEYSGRGYAYLDMYKNLSMVFGVSLITVLYFGGPLGPLFGKFMGLLGFLYFGLKALLISILMILISSVAVRVRVYGLADRLWFKCIVLLFIQAILAFYWRLII